MGNLTIQGDPAVPLNSIPQFTLSAVFTVGAAQDGFTLKHANIGLITAGSVVFNAGGTITDSVLVDINSTTPTPITFSGVSDVLSNSTVITNTAIGNTVLQVSTSTGGSSHTIANNTFVVNAGPTNAVLAYFGGSGAAVTDRVEHNLFFANPGVAVNFFLVVQEAVTGLTIQDNSFSSSNVVTGILQISSARELKILYNRFDLSKVGATAISLQGGNSGTLTSAVVANNSINTHGTGTGMRITAGINGTSALNLEIEGNDLHGNNIGVQVSGGGGPVGNIDLGGGSLGSLGGNNFRSFTTAATPGAGAIVLAGVAGAQGIIHAQRNLFADGITPASVVSDSNSNLDLTNQLTANAAFVQSLYQTFLKRTGDTTNPIDAGKFVTALDSHKSKPASVAAAIVGSAEGRGILVDELFSKLLGRDPIAVERTKFITLAKGGIEKVLTKLVALPEYVALAGSGGAFIQSLYTQFLGRTGTNAEVTAASLTLATKHAAGLAKQILASMEFRTLAVEQMLGAPAAPIASVGSLLPNLLHQTAVPSPAQLDPLVKSRKSLSSIQARVAASTDFFTKG